jgi:two-component system sensor histidine kinase PilS (NtrC family)
VPAAGALVHESAAAVPAPAGDALHRKLVWLTLFRIATITVLLGGTAVVNWQFGAQATAVVAPLYGVVVATYAASLVFAVLLRLRSLERVVAAAQIALDVGLAVAVVAVTGLSESVFVFMFLLAIVNGSILLNRAGEQITGLRFADVRGEPGERWFPNFGGDARGEATFVNARQAERLLGYTAFDLHDRAGERRGTAVIFQDLTDLRAMEEAVQRTKRLADLGQVAAGLAHEVRNPLASISGCVELLRGAQGLSSEDQRALGIVLRETGRLDQLLTRFLEFSRPATLERRPVDLAVVAAETVDAFAADPAAAGLALWRALEPSPVECDPDQLRQVLWNLLGNAAQAISEAGRGSSVTVSCAALPDGGATLAVDDDGPGISQEALGQLFTPFFTTKASGTGLGLSVVQRIVDAHGGSVSVHSPPGGGARFAVRLPGARSARNADPR